MGVETAPYGVATYKLAQSLSANQSTTNLGSANKVAINKDPSGTMSLAITADGVRPWLIELFIPQTINSQANNGVACAIFEGSTQLATAFHTSATANASGLIDVKALLDGTSSTAALAIPSAGVHTYTAFFWAVTAGTATIAPSSLQSAFFMATQL